MQKHLLKEMLLHANWGLLTYPPPKLGPLEKHLGGEICLRLWGLGYLTHPVEVRWISPGFTEKGNALTTQHNNFTLCDLLRFKIRPLNFCSSQILSLFFFSPSHFAFHLHCHIWFHFIFHWKYPLLGVNSFLTGLQILVLPCQSLLQNLKAPRDHHRSHCRGMECHLLWEIPGWKPCNQV